MLLEKINVIMNKKHNIRKLYASLSIGTFVLFLAFIFFSSEDFSYNILRSSSQFLANILLTCFTITCLLFFKITIGTFDGDGFTDLLWKSFLTSLATVVLVFFSIFLVSIFGLNIKAQIFVYYISYTAIILFVNANFYVFKKMILYQKTKETANLWQIFEILIYISIALNFLQISNKDILFPLAIIPVLVMGLILTLNLKWIAYLNFKQKIKASLFLFMLFFFNGVFVFIAIQSDDFQTIGASLSSNLFLISLLVFIGFYAIVSLLVLLFNLPTTSVFEQKFSEVLNLQRISNTTQIGKTEDEVYELLIDSCSGTFMSQATVLEIIDDNKIVSKTIYRNMTMEDYALFQVFFKKNSLNLKKEYVVIDDILTKRHVRNIENLPFLSLLAIPLINYGEQLGTIYLFSEIKSAFEKQMIEIVLTYVNQASTSISNYRLLKNAVENARYHEEVEIAKKVKSNLLPTKTIDNEDIEFDVIYQSADDVGGDYFDFSILENNMYAIVIGDVSGKGSSAAFNMATLKGIFQSLILTEKNPEEFMIKANKVLSICLEKSSFITLTLLVFDTKNYTLNYVRAGHCPGILYQHTTKKIIELNAAGLGLGIMRNDTFQKFVYKEEIALHWGDLLMFFTDGIVEAKNSEDEAFGYERVSLFLEKNSSKNPHELTTLFLAELNNFCGSEILNDDYTAIFIRLK